MFSWDNFIQAFEWNKMPDQVRATIVITGSLSLIFIILYFFIRRIDSDRNIPKWFVPFYLGIEMFNKFVKVNIGKRWRFYAPIFLYLVIFIFISNISGIFTLTPPTTYIMTNATLAIGIFILIQGSAIASKGLIEYIKDFFQPIFILFPINVIGELAFPLALTLRITGNLLSGLVLSNMIIGFLGRGSIIVIPFINAIFDLFFGLIQTYVFVLLSVIFISMKIDDSEKIYLK